MHAYDNIELQNWNTALKHVEHDYITLYTQTANEDPRNSEFESKRILNVEGGLS